jgi:hypothetical protein
MGVCKPAIFVEDKRPAHTDNSVEADGTSENGAQTAIRGEMGSEQVDDEEDQEPKAKSDREAFCHNRLPTILKN